VLISQGGITQQFYRFFLNSSAVKAFVCGPSCSHDADPVRLHSTTPAEPSTVILVPDVNADIIPSHPTTAGMP